MRTTFRIDDDLLARLKEAAEREGVPLTRLVNRVLRAGLATLGSAVADAPPYTEETFAMGEPRVDLHKAGTLAALLEDEELVRRLGLGK